MVPDVSALPLILFSRGVGAQTTKGFTFNEAKHLFSVLLYLLSVAFIP